LWGEFENRFKNGDSGKSRVPRGKSLNQRGFEAPFPPLSAIRSGTFAPL
jgi:hypothetical protein